MHLATTRNEYTVAGLSRWILNNNNKMVIIKLQLQMFNLAIYDYN